MDFKHDTLLPDLDPLDQLSPTQSVTPAKLSRKRKHSTYTEHNSDDDQHHDHDGFGPSRRQRPPGAKRACNQCRQQKLKCNVSEDPWRDCDRCTKHSLRCEITADFKRIGKRSQQAELEKTNRLLADQVQQLSRELAVYRSRGAEFELYKDYSHRAPIEHDPALTSGPQSMAQADESHDAALLLNLKQGHDISGPVGRAGPAIPQRKLGEVYLHPETIQQLWDEYYNNYHIFLPVLDPEVDTPDLIFDHSEFLFWTVIFIASRHFQQDATLLLRLLPAYKDMINETISRPPTNHFIVKALCLTCYWPPPVSSTTADMTFTWSGTMMKFAMQLGLHRPSHAMDFSRTRVQLREEDIHDRLKTWAICNLVAQNISTGYGQPPETVYDSTLTAIQPNGKYAHLHTRLEIEKLANKIAMEIYSTKQQGLAGMEENHINIRANIIAQELANINDIINPITHLYTAAVNVHLRLFVFFDDPASPPYQLNLNELYNAASEFLKATFNTGVSLQHMPNYIYQMMLAAAVALLKLLHSFFAEFVDREGGEDLFWETIKAIREMSVKTNDLPQRLAEVFAQMWQVDTERLESEVASNGTKSSDVPGASLTLKRRNRMSMSLVFDSIWRWKDEIDGKLRAEKLETAVQNPTSPQASQHRHSFSNGRRPSNMMDENTTLPGMTSFGGFGGLTLGGTNDLAYANSYEFFDPVGWYLDGLFESSGMGYGTA
ncbi:hypothetical protein BT63DRAFT_427895 [Microthyrium microscopicum]|uniref:Zn(2)-C6 fungal-type domain-containing protein n=1 Tax=Microthyrium microscopicum TaxID=703497 RepID=A0A6A6U3C9_9PEZI|nr:hypothetical protein BT63DRAFT_427895 [Microthyrium microscopicum]